MALTNSRIRLLEVELNRFNDLNCCGFQEESDGDRDGTPALVL